MRIIKSIGGYIQVDQPANHGLVWGWRWNANEGKWSNLCQLWPNGVEVSENDLPRIKPLEIDSAE